MATLQRLCLASPQDPPEQLHARLVTDMKKETAGTSGGLAALVGVVRFSPKAAHVEEGCWVLSAEINIAKSPCSP